MRQSRVPRFRAAVALFFGMLTVACAAPRSNWAQDSAKGQGDLTTAIQQVAKQNIPAVVHIEVTETKQIANPLLPFENDPLFRYFFNVPKKMPKKFERQLTGIGSGILIDEAGHILTNHHVVGNATKILVLLADGRKYTEESVRVVGSDPKTDLAVIQISARDPFPFARFGDSDKVDVGQWVVAIGHPRGLDQTVTQGIISAKHRHGITDPSSYQDYLQTDAAINPGNSGGPLLNLQGEVIGINTAIQSQSGGFEGIGFSIPSNMAAHISAELIAKGKVVRGWIGLNIQDLTPEMAQSFGTDVTKGVLIAEVVKGGPAAQAGMKRGDIVVGYEDKKVANAAEFRNDVSVAPIGREVKLTVLRDGEKLRFTLKIGTQQEQEQALTAALRQRLGASFRLLTSKESEQYGLDSENGLVITGVDPKGPLGALGLEEDDVILQINNRQLDGLAGLDAALSGVKSGDNAVLVVLDHRTGEKGVVQATLP